MMVKRLYVQMLVRKCTSLEELVENVERQLQPVVGPLLSLTGNTNMYVFHSTVYDCVF